MAVDEALLRRVTAPVLRLYSWDRPAVSIGYFQSPDVVPPGREFVRRFTGGGLVDHAGDRTYTLVLPREHPLGLAGASSSYCSIHRALVRALEAAGVAATLTSEDLPGVEGVCFRKPVRHDVLDAGGVKLAGAAQRRTREGVLHQGSIRAGDLPTGWTECLAPAFAELLDVAWIRSDLAADEESLALGLERSRYGCAEWNRSRGSGG
jgi:lipoate-protein ligase A